MGPKEPPDLFSYGPGARDSDPETSHLAAGAHPKIRGKDRINCLLAHASNPAGLTDYELAAIVGRQQNSAGKRRTELRDRGLVEDSGIRRKNERTGANCIVWRITTLGKHLMGGWQG
jgi:hypothetical protein